MKRIIISILSLAVILFLGVAAYLKFVLPDVGYAPDIHVESTPENIAHGEYLANHVAACVDCHSSRDWSRFSGPMLEGTLGQGGEFFGRQMGFPGDFYSKNLTSTHLGDWTDGEIFRAITTGVSKDGKALFPVMPYLYYGQMDRQDIMDIIAYLRTIDPIDNETPTSQADFPMNFIINTIPHEADFHSRPDKTDKLVYGAYLTNVAACMECHTPVKKGQPIIDQAFSGGREFEMPGGILRSANLTPDDDTGIGTWTKEMFVDHFKSYENLENLQQVESGDFNTLMPWNMYAGMEKEDLGAIFDYLKSMEPIHNEVAKFTPKEKLLP